MSNAKSNPNKPITVCRDVKIGNTVYRLTSKFEGKKNLDETLKRLAVKRTGKFTG